MIERDGGPAFPVTPDTEVGHASAFRGMSLRDYFAGMALAGMALLHRPEMIEQRAAASDAYAYADAMLDERSKQGT